MQYTEAKDFISKIEPEIRKKLGIEKVSVDIEILDYEDFAVSAETSALALQIEELVAGHPVHFGSCGPLSTKEGKEKYAIEILYPNKTFVQLESTLAHEMRHVWQFETKTFIKFGSIEYWNGVPTFNGTVPYDAQKHEQDARQFAFDWLAAKGITAGPENTPIPQETLDEKALRHNFPINWEEIVVETCKNEIAKVVFPTLGIAEHDALLTHLISVLDKDGHEGLLDLWNLVIDKAREKGIL